MRRAVLFLFCAAILAGCGPSGLALRDPGGLAESLAAGDNAAFQFSHWLNLTMGQATVRPRFNRAKSRCLKETALHCRLLKASFRNWNGKDGPSSSANLSVALPHDQVAAFETRLMKPVAGESAGSIKVISRGTRSANVSDDLQASTHKLTQLTDYLGRLTTLAKRRNITVGDLIKLQSEISKVDSQIGDLKDSQAALKRRIGEERLTISLGRNEDTSLLGPARRVWTRGLSLIAQSAGHALEFAIEIIPWLPLILAVFFLFPWLWRIARRKPAAPNATDGA